MAAHPEVTGDIYVDLPSNAVIKVDHQCTWHHYNPDQKLVLRGNGYGHGVGMCQWGAIGRARAGQTARAILAAYYPGTSVGPAS